MRLLEKKTAMKNLVTLSSKRNGRRRHTNTAIHAHIYPSIHPSIHTRIHTYTPVACHTNLHQAVLKVRNRDVHVTRLELRCDVFQRVHRADAAIVFMQQRVQARITGRLRVLVHKQQAVEVVVVRIRGEVPAQKS